MSINVDQLQPTQLRRDLLGSQPLQGQSSVSSSDQDTLVGTSLLQPHSSAHLPDAVKHVPDTFTEAQEKQSAAVATDLAEPPTRNTCRWQQQQHRSPGLVPSYAPFAQLEPQLVHEIGTALENAVVTAVTAVTKWACSSEQHKSPIVVQLQQQDTAASMDQRSAYVRQLLAADAHASAACNTASPVSCWTNRAPTDASQASPQTTWQQQQQLQPLLPQSPLVSPHGSAGTFSETAAGPAAAATFSSSCTKLPAGTAVPAPPPPTATLRRPAPVRRRTFNCMPQFMPAGSVGATAATPTTPSAAGSILEAPWASVPGPAFVGCPPHLLSHSLARASSTGDISAYPAVPGPAIRRNSSSSINSSCCSRLSDCSSGFASSRCSSNDGSASSTSSSPLAMSTLLTASAYGQLQPQAAGVTAGCSPGGQLLLRPLLLHAPSIPTRLPSPPQESPAATGASPGKTSPRTKFICPAAPSSPFAAGLASTAAGRHSSSRFAPVAPPRALLQHGVCGGAELRASVGRYRRHSVSMSGLAGEASSLSDGAVGAAASVLDSVGAAGPDCVKLRWSGRSLDGRSSDVGSRMSGLPGGVAGDGGGAAAFAVAAAAMMAAVGGGATGVASQ